MLRWVSLPSTANTNSAKTYAPNRKEGTTAPDKKKSPRYNKMALEHWTQKVINELQTHAQKGCPNCKRLLTELTIAYGVDPKTLTKKGP